MSYKMDTQKMIESFLNDSPTNIILRDLVDLPDFFSYLTDAVERFNAYRLGNYYQSKNNRLNGLTEASEAYVVKAFILGVAYSGLPLVSVAALYAPMIGRDIEAIKTAAEILAVCKGDLYELEKDVHGTYKVQSLVELDPNVEGYIGLLQYLPPMLVKPRKLKHNMSSGYVLIKSNSLILGSHYNHHDGEISIDVLNIQNQIPFHINQWLLDNFEEPQLQEEVIWEQYLKEKALVLELMGDEEFYFTNKVDKRGRIYSQGYHLNPQGTEFNKALLELPREPVSEI